MKINIPKFIISLTTIFFLSIPNLNAEISKWFKEGLELYQKQNYNDAILNIRKVIENDPENAQAYYYIGMCYLMTQQFDDAIDNFTISIKLDSKNPDAFNNRGIANGYIGNPDAAFADFDRAILLDPNFSEAYLNRGTAFIEKQDFENAEKDLLKSIKYDKNNPSAYYHIGRMKISNGNREEAIKYYKLAIKYGMNAPDVYFELGNVYFSKKHYKSAITEYSNAIKIDPRFDKALNNRAMAYENTGNKQLAQNDRDRINEITGVTFIDKDKIKYKEIFPDNKAFKLKIPSHWHKKNFNDTNMVEIFISPYDLSENRPVLTSIDITMQTDLQNRYGVSQSGDIINFWRSSNEMNFEDYETNDVKKIKTLFKNGFDIRIFHNEIQRKPGEMVYRHISYVAAKQDKLVYAYFVCPKIQLLYYEPIFEEIMKSITINE